MFNMFDKKSISDLMDSTKGQIAEATNFTQRLFEKEKESRNEIPDIVLGAALADALRHSTFEYVGTAGGVNSNAQIVSDQLIFNARNGHGFAAEKINHLYDRIRLKDASIVGGDNAKNGADRLVDGQHIQTKFYQTGKGCIDACFKDGTFRYMQDQKPMRIEVPSDKYDAAISEMQRRIQRGEVQGVSDPAQAENLIIKSRFTYRQAQNVAKFGNIDSLKFDAINGLRVAGTAMGISGIITFAVCIWNDMTPGQALQESCKTGIRVGGIAWASSVITSQLGRTGIDKALKPASDWLVKKIGLNGAKAMTGGGGKALNSASKLIRSSVIASAVTTTVMSVPDFIDVFKNRISWQQLTKNVSKTGAGVFGGAGGYLGGVALAGIVLPGAGTVIVMGTALAGSLVAGYGASKVTSYGMDLLIEDDGKKMLAIMQEIFASLASAHLLTQKEADEVVRILQEGNDTDDQAETVVPLAHRLKEMHAAQNRRVFAYKMVNPIVLGVVKKRCQVALPSDIDVAANTADIVTTATESGLSPNDVGYDGKKTA
ncbi:hypothetical protein [Larsenimonas suaedae]|uniref:Uncharacterized protein n=1 Tax=Larsenimonas suaedae TaxID=1851019 RepID=A0ABU1GTN2_9GAMM|nr:hypothetical protein [Larsenimonas suaedae]MCM2971792.1 hypothetical protein [Larsenimonas suaedae]MDR5895344.1 hypothetical protein [Larsenimonas suaedae]